MATATNYRLHNADDSIELVIITNEGNITYCLDSMEEVAPILARFNLKTK